MKKAVLEALKTHKNQYISGEELSVSLGVSRTMVWKVISQLREEGYCIESSSKKGYILLDDRDQLSQAELDVLLDQVTWIKKGYYFESIDSTNTQGKRLALEQDIGPALLVADEQTAGRGRLGRHWHSQKGDGLWMSLILKPNLEPKDAFIVTLISAVSVAEAIESLYAVEAGIKWPNDILIQGKKVCGILSEMSAEWQTINYIITGIGINANHKDFPEEIAEIATSLRRITGAVVDRRLLLKEILVRFEHYFKAVESEAVHEALLDSYKRHSITLGQVVRVIGMNERIGKAIELTQEGELLVEFEDGSREVVYHGEVSVRGIDFNA